MSNGSHVALLCIAHVTCVSFVFNSFFYVYICKRENFDLSDDEGILELEIETKELQESLVNLHITESTFHRR